MTKETRPAQHRDKIGYFVVREAEGTAEIEVQDAEPFASHDEAEQWIHAHGIPGVEYWVCAPVHEFSFKA